MPNRLGITLDTIVESVQNSSDNDKALKLNYESSQIFFILPLSLEIKKGDRLSFGEGKLSQNPNGENIIRHNNYYDLVWSRGGEELAYLRGRDMCLIEIAKSYRF